MEDFTAHLPGLLLVYAAFTLMVASPGPSTLAIMATAMERGRGTGVTLALGVTAGSFTWGLLATAGVSTLIAAHAGALTAIKIAGGLYLLFLAWKSARSAMRPDEAVAALVTSGLERPSRVFLRGYLMHLTNPKAILGWIAIMSLGLAPDAPRTIILAILMGCLLISLTFNCGYALLFSTEPMVRGYRRIRRWAEGILAGFFVLASFKLLTLRP